ncbi:MAG: hypothetical protein EA366_08685 [Spirulina sp. DLM2.Bin59]|nr:MAG: hypothetical protein EA366_08685 [Spirulina sp. DLM2.Bin59]
MHTPQTDQAHTARQSQTEGELLDQLTTTEELYPWNPARADDYFVAVEAAVEEFDLPAEEWESRAENFFKQLDGCWAPRGVEQALQRRFAQTIPAAWLQEIANQAQKLATSSLSPVEQLVACVRPLLKDWTLEDLNLFARPLVYAMRSDMAAIPSSADWQSLTPVEQARYTLQVAQYALESAQDRGNDA